MLNSFRKIRKQLAAENNVKKYLRYAIGETLLVVIGILVALQINNWNEERKVQIKSKVYIEKLINDLVSDTININTLISRAQQMQQNIEEYFILFEIGNIPLSNLIDSTKNVEWSFFRYLPVNYTFTDMLTSGNSGLLSEEQRKSLIKLSQSQEFLTIVIEKVITDVKNEEYERNKYLDFDLSKGNFFKTISVIQNKNKIGQGLLHQHNLFTQVHSLSGFMKSIGEQIKSDTKHCLEILTEESKP